MMADKQVVQSRRKLLQLVFASGSVVVAEKSLPDTWVRPVVETVLLPAHAQMTEPRTQSCDGDFCRNTFTWNGSYFASNRTPDPFPDLFVAGYYGTVITDERCDSGDDLGIQELLRIIPENTGLAIELYTDGAWRRVCESSTITLDLVCPISNGCVGEIIATGSFSGTPFTEDTTAVLSGTAEECCEEDVN